MVAYALAELANRDRHVEHPVRESPFVVVPGQYANKLAINNLGLRQIEIRRIGIVVEVD